MQRRTEGRGEAKDVDEKDQTLGHKRPHHLPPVQRVSHRRDHGDRVSAHVWLPARAEPGLLSSLSTMSTAGASVTLGLRGCALSVRLCARVVGLRSAALVLRSPGLRSCAKDVTCVCRSCLVKYLEENNTCPTCRIVIHQSHPLQYIGHDRTMQDIVYKLVPGLQEAEMRKQREFYHKLGMEVPGDIKGETCSAKQHLDSHRNGETKADDSLSKETAEEKPEEDNDYHRSDEQVSICLECNSSKLRGLKRKWIRCSAQATVLHLKKFIAKKLNLSSFNEAYSRGAELQLRTKDKGRDATHRLVALRLQHMFCHMLGPALWPKAACSILH
ncbi:polycomb group RING finger protein 3 isoform X2 [Manis javanica]|uniref:polycomb group RING finger protein 3 isoform X2 n=1 Tax=Manis javanica TaxID=9974 RepID=UPI003C6D5A7B